MAFAMWDTFFNLFLLAFWFHLWTGSDFRLSYNPYLGTFRRLTNAVIAFLKPAFVVLSERAVALVAILMLLTLRAFAAPHTDSGWILHVGFEWRQPQEGDMGSFLIFTLLSFAVFLFRLWSFAIVFLRTDAHDAQQQPTSALHALCEPFVRIPYLWRPPALLAFGMILVAALSLSGPPTHLSPYTQGLVVLPSPSASPTFIVGCLISAMRGWVEVLSLLVQMMLIFIIGSWVGLLTGTPAVSLACREWTDTLLGPLRRYPLRIGMIDLSPLIYIVVLGLVQGFLHAILLSSYVRITGAGP